MVILYYIIIHKRPSFTWYELKQGLSHRILRCIHKQINKWVNKQTNKQFQVMHYTNNYFMPLITNRAFRITFVVVFSKRYVIRERHKHRRSYAPHFIVIHQRGVFSLHMAYYRDVCRIVYVVCACKYIYSLKCTWLCIIYDGIEFPGRNGNWIVLEWERRFREFPIAVCRIKYQILPAHSFLI